MSATLDLKCLICGNCETMDASKCLGSDNPVCGKCFGPMIAESATAPLLRPAAKIPDNVDWSKPIKVNKPAGGA